MQARPLKDDGCTVVDAPYKEEDLDASKLGVDTSFPVLRSPWLKVASDFVKAPVYSTFITPNSPWLVPMMFGRTSSELPEAFSIRMTTSQEVCTKSEFVTKVMSVTTAARFLDLMLHFHLLFTA